METIKSQKSDIELAVELKQVIEQRKDLEKAEKRLKSYFKTKFESLGIDTATIGKVLISLVQKSRLGIDRKALEVQLGADFLKTFQTQTTYIQVDVKEVNESVVAQMAA